MDWVNFGLLLSDNLVLYAGTLLGSLLIYLLIFKRLYISILDPFIFSLIYSVFGFSVVWFLYFTRSMDTRYLVSYMLTQVAFWLGIFSFKSLKKREIVAPVKFYTVDGQHFFEKIFFITASAVYI